MLIDATAGNLAILEALASDTRLAMIGLLNERSLNISELAEALSISSAIVTRHVQKLESAGLIRCTTQSGRRGMQKICSLAEDALTVRLRMVTRSADVYVHEIPVGQYTAYAVQPTCGLASATGLIGLSDDPRYFADPAHIHAELLWFGCGWVEYRIPNYLLGNQTVRSLEVSLELCSEAPRFDEHHPSDISFLINGRHIGIWTSPGDFGTRKGTYTPDWWNGGTQYGLLKTIRIDESGSFIDGVRMSDTTIADLSIRYGSEITFRLGVDEKARHMGGLNLFGRGFGNYRQDIRVTMAY